MIKIMNHKETFDFFTTFTAHFYFFVQKPTQKDRFYSIFISNADTSRRRL